MFTWSAIPYLQALSPDQKAADELDSKLEDSHRGTHDQECSSDQLEDICVTTSSKLDSNLEGSQGTSDQENSDQSCTKLKEVCVMTSKAPALSASMIVAQQMEVVKREFRWNESQWKVTGELGKGGSGVVYKVRSGVVRKVKVRSVEFQYVILNFTHEVMMGHIFKGHTGTQDD